MHLPYTKIMLAGLTSFVKVSLCEFVAFSLSVNNLGFLVSAKQPDSDDFLDSSEEIYYTARSNLVFLIF